MGLTNIIILSLCIVGTALAQKCRQCNSKNDGEDCRKGFTPHTCDDVRCEEFYYKSPTDKNAHVERGCESSGLCEHAKSKMPNKTWDNDCQVCQFNLCNNAAYPWPHQRSNLGGEGNFFPNKK